MLQHQNADSPWVIPAGGILIVEQTGERLVGRVWGPVEERGMRTNCALINLTTGKQNGGFQDLPVSTTAPVLKGITQFDKFIEEAK